MRRFGTATLSIAIAAALAGCGGGGGSSTAPLPSGSGSTTPVPNASPTVGPSGAPSPSPPLKPSPTPTATPTAVASPTPTPAASSVSASGRVVDDSGAPVAGASVYVGGALPTGATPVGSSYGAVATTAADGSFAVNGIKGANTGENYDPAHFGWTGTWIVVWPRDPALPVYHVARVFANTAGANPLGTITLARVSADDLTALAAMNAYRAAQGSPPLALDETLVEAARYWDAYIVRYPGTGHSCVPGIDPPDCVNAQGFESARGERGAGENLGGAGTAAANGGALPAGWPGLLAAYESEAAQCPQPAQYATCAAYQQTLFASGQPDYVGHWINLVNPSLTWTGLALIPDTRPGSSPNDLIGDGEFGSLI